MWAAVHGVDVADGPVASAVQTLVQVSVQGLLLEAWAGPVAFVVQNLVQVSVQGWLLEAWPRPVATKATATTTATAATRTATPVCDTIVGTMLGHTSRSSHARGRKLPPPHPRPYIV